jgi:nucleotide sugar dehydrogenase
MKISVIGIGRLGLGVALLLENAGHEVLGVDIRKGYVNSINNKTFQTKEPKYNELLATSKNLRATTNLEDAMNFSDIIILMVQTPNSGGEKFYDHNILSNVLIQINEYKVENKHIIIGCTVMPKYIDTIGTMLISDCKNTTLSYNPEFIAQGDIINGLKRPDMVLIGTHSKDLEVTLTNIYKSVVENEPKFCILTPLEAEITKISINGYITTKISYANMISDLCDNVNANASSVLNAIGSDGRIGNNYFKPGYSFGGPCFPRDTKALALCMSQNNIDNSILVATSHYNVLHSDFLTQKFLKENKDDYTFQDICYKANSKVPIIEESAKLKIAKNLVDKGKSVTIKDEPQLINEVKKEYGNIFKYVYIS